MDFILDQTDYKLMKSKIKKNMTNNKMQKKFFNNKIQE